MLRTPSVLGRLAVAAGLWAALAGFADAQGKGKGGGGRGGGGNRPSAGRSAPARPSTQRAPAVRQAPQGAAPRVQAPQLAAPRQAPVNRDRVDRDRVTRDRDIDRRTPQQRNFARNRDGDRDWNRRGDYYGRYGYGHHDHDDDDWWQYLAFGVAARALGLGTPFGWYGYGGYGAWPHYGYGNYGYGYGYGGYGYPRYYDRGYYYEPYYSESAPEVTDDVVTIDVFVPDPNARVWVQGRETSAQGTERQYVSPPLERGYNYTYTVRARWREDGETREAERLVPVRPGRSATVDFTRGPVSTLAE
jgi:uncharacterized protein (TIGR03000 family)